MDWFRLLIITLVVGTRGGAQATPPQAPVGQITVTVTADARRVREVLDELRQRKDPFIAKMLSANLELLVDAMLAHAGTPQPDGTYMMERSGPQAAGLFNYKKYALKPSSTARAFRIRVGAEVFAFTKLGFCQMVLDAAGKEARRKTWELAQPREVERQFWWLNEQAGFLLKPRSEIESALLGLPGKDRVRVATRFFAVADKMAASMTAYDLIPFARTVSTDQWMAGRLAVFDKTAELHPDKVHFTYRGDTYEGDINTFVMFLIGVLIEPDHGLALADAILGHLEEQIRLR